MGIKKFNIQRAIIAMDHTIAGAASGETAGIPRRRRVHNLRQKDRRVLEYLFVVLTIVSMANIICYTYDHEIGCPPISFFYGS